VSPSDFAAAFALFESDTAIQTVLSVVERSSSELDRA